MPSHVDFPSSISYLRLLCLIPCVTASTITPRRPGLIPNAPWIPNWGSKPPPGPLNWATIGDSWASGVTYGLFGWTDYDDNSSGCMRLKHAYGPQLDGDWPQGVPKGKFTFQACSGHRLIDMADPQNHNTQMFHIPKDSQFVTMQAGGNDAGFFAVASNCLFHQEGKDYGAEYPGAGECLNSINQVERYLEGLDPQRAPFVTEVDNTINDVLINENAQAPGFKLYVLGYAHLFNIDSPDSDWCNDQSFGLSFNEWVNGKRPKLSKQLRTKINDLTTLLNSKIEASVKGHDPSKVTYISVTEGFDGHRFCEKGSNILDQYAGTNVWLWNVSPADLLNLQQTQANDPKANETTLLLGDWDNAVQQNQLNGNWSNIINKTNVFIPDLDGYNFADVLQLDKGPKAQSPHQGWSPGSALRPLHPTKAGHEAIKNALKQQVAKDFGRK